MSNLRKRIWTESTMSSAIPAVVGGFAVIKKKWPNIVATPDPTILRKARNKRPKRISKNFSLSRQARQ